MVSFMFKISFMIFCLKILYLSTYIVHTLCSGMSYIMLDDVGTFKRVPLSTTVQVCRSRGCLHSIHRFDRSVNSITTRRHRLIAQHITTRTPPGFSYLPTALPSTTTISCTELSRVAVQSAQCQVNIWKGSFFSPFLQPRLGYGCLLYSLLLVVQVKILVIFFTFFSLDSN